jgi:carbohydrate-selective porin OprB
MVLLQTKDEKKHLVQKVLDLEEALKIKQTSFRVPTLDVSCECMLNFENNIGSSKHGEDVETDIFPEVRFSLYLGLLVL